MYTKYCLVIFKNIQRYAMHFIRNGAFARAVLENEKIDKHHQIFD